MTYWASCERWDRVRGFVGGVERGADISLGTTNRERNVMLFEHKTVRDRNHRRKRKVVVDYTRASISAGRSIFLES